MKQYEATYKSSLLRRTPTIIRVDGKAFHTWTKYLSPGVDPSVRTSPFSDIMHGAMTHAMMYAMEEMQNVQLAYTQSDEISFFLRDWDTHETQQWFGGGVQKIASVTASLVTAGFIQYLYHHSPVLMVNNRYPSFDARVFQLPKEEVCNLLIWRQQDAVRNSINMLAQYHFSHKELHGKNVSNIQDMLVTKKGINWNNLETWKKRGSCAYRGENGVVLDAHPPIFTEDREYVERFVII